MISPEQGQMQPSPPYGPPILHPCGGRANNGPWPPQHWGPGCGPLPPSWYPGHPASTSIAFNHDLLQRCLPVLAHLLAFSSMDVSATIAQLAWQSDQICDRGARSDLSFHDLHNVYHKLYGFISQCAPNEPPRSVGDFLRRMLFDNYRKPMAGSHLSLSRQNMSLLRLCTAFSAISHQTHSALVGSVLERFWLHHGAGIVAECSVIEAWPWADAICRARMSRANKDACLQLFNEQHPHLSSIVETTGFWRDLELGGALRRAANGASTRYRPRSLSLGSQGTTQRSRSLSRPADHDHRLRKLHDSAAQIMWEISDLR
ncbi:hypothetical protein BAUCODRAFT_131315 [Baudoinia panamericana UAMH 10762]|uniref:Uncharacterized protein n=1 Tax=Baudoinia panamericana (strain UAMH 10762) TaxID=717646 RepID=M2ND08_BAUPA|nr:uncharacterized protein BAUCODRAFT_131315 [Baudoinia panamericana UAMH 10762]EMC96810.1 hypothetical protein BAUCODRAFT_131315 [Baudoinia panamericana UAMH 10762]